MQYSPKLKNAMEAIKTILKQNDIAGFVVLHEPGYAEFVNEISPSYSCAKIENGNIRIRLKVSEVGKEKATELATDTLNMIQSFADVIGRHGLMYIETEEMLNKQWPNDSTSEGSSHEQQNN